MDENYTEQNSVRLNRRWRGLYDNRRRWLTTPIKILLILLILVGLVFLGRWIHRSLKTDSIQPAGSSSQITKRPDAGGNQLPGSSSQPSGNQFGGQFPSDTADQPSTGQLPNSGPGDVAAIFLLSSLVAGSLHYTFRRPKTD